MTAIKRRYTLTAVFESVSDYNDYEDPTVDPPRKMTEVEARKSDEECILDDPCPFLTRAKITVKIEDLP